MRVRTLDELDKLMVVARHQDPAARRLTGSLDITERQISALYEQIASLQASAKRIEDQMLALHAERGWGMR